MKKIILYLLGGMLVLSFSQCGKDGSIGPEGPRGERGEKGDRGDKGAKGDDGTSILSGKGAPSSSVGDVGDFYLDLSSSNLYGPKTTSGWGSPTSIQGATGAKGDKGATGAKGDKGDKGATGAKGQDGSQFLSGAAAPTASLGKVGDFYFRTSTSLLYGPKTASGWGTGTSLKGAKGDKGEKGDKGDKGDPGNANVRVYTKDIRNLTWSTVGSTAEGYLRLEISAPNVLTRDVIENWTILSYVKSTDYAGDWALLPYYTDRKIRVQSQFHEGRLILKRDQDGKPATQSSFSFVKVVLIEPSQTNILSRAVDFNDYHAVAKHFNLEN